MIADVSGGAGSTSRLFAGAAIGCTLGLALASFRGAALQAEQAGAQGNVAVSVLQSYPHVWNDCTLQVALQEPVLLFVDLDRDTTLQFLDSLEQLCGVAARLRGGYAKPGIVATAIRSRRDVSRLLHALVRKARQKRPLLATELDEDLESVRKSIDGYVHNCMQQSNLNVMEQRQ